MLLGPLFGDPSPRKFVTYDLEWWPGSLELRMVGVFDGHRFRYYKTIAEFLAGELTHKNRGTVFYAHAGGSYDVQFILEEVLARRPDVELEATFSGSAAVIVAAKYGGHTWTFADSFFLLRDSLAKIGDAIGLEKLDKGAITSEDFADLVTYNERDCVILWNAIDQLQAELNEAGGEMRNTLASSAMDLFRRSFLKTAITTSIALNEEVSGAYSASRVEVIRPACKKAKYYDVCSSFPASMSLPQPANLLRTSKRLPGSPDPSRLFIARCDVLVPEMYLPPLPFRSEEGRIMFPTGQWEAWLDSADVDLMLRTGCKILKVHEVRHFAAFSELADYVALIYERKRTAEGFKRLVYKLLLNSLYGKFAERPDKSKILIHPKSTRCPHDPPHENSACLEMIAPGIWELEERVSVPHGHLPISIHTTALSRALLYDTVLAPSGEDLYYTDTDSGVTTRELPTSETEELGTLKLEYVIEEGEFLAPKLYSFATTDGKRKVKSKGFSRLSYEQFRDLAEGRDVVFQRMARIREVLRDGGPYHVKDLNIRKRVIGATPKRAPCGENNTRPWTAEEIREAS